MDPTKKVQLLIATLETKNSELENQKRIVETMQQEVVELRAFRREFQPTLQKLQTELDTLREDYSALYQQSSS